VNQQMTRDGRNQSAGRPFNGAVRSAIPVGPPFKGAIRGATVVVLGISLIACGGGDSDREAATAAATAAATGSGPAALPTAPSDDWKPKIRTATLPENPCDLIPVAEVEAILGKLAEPPRKDDGCRYILPVPEAVTAKQEQAKAAREKFGKAFGLPPEEQRQKSIFDEQEDPKSFSVTVRVDLNAKPDLQPPAEETTDAAPWDQVRRSRSGLNGRIGHIQIVVNRQSPDVPTEPMYALAEKVRESIPDLPFAVTNPYQVIQRNDGDPCSLLTRAEVEAVVGPLAMEPYRSSTEWPALAHGRGHACAYYSAGHRVFAVAPQWSDGAQSYKISKGIGGLIGIVLPQENVVMKGPWDEAGIDGGTGALMFLKGDRLLEVYYGTSRATRGDAVKLAATAMPRLAP